MQLPTDLFPWHESFDTGIAVIDVQHRRLVALLNRLAYSVVAEPDPRETEIVLQELVASTAEHFSTEEAIWHEHFGGTHEEALHCKGHAEFLVEVERLQLAHCSPTDHDPARDAVTFLARWLMAHILEADRRMAFEIQARRAGLPEELASVRAQEMMRHSTQIMVDTILELYGRHAVTTLQLKQELLAHRSARDTLKRQDAYRALILRLGMSFINLPGEALGAAIQGALAEMSEFFDADRAYVFHYDLSAKTASNIHEWCAPGVVAMIDELQQIPSDPLWSEKHLHGMCFVVLDVETLPEPSRAHFQSQQIRSLLTAPLMDGDTCLGFVGFDSVRERRAFGQDEREALALFANLLTSVSQRLAVAASLHEKTKALALAHNRMLSILDGTNASLYVADMETYEVLFINSHGRELLGDIVGKTCWKAIQGKNDGPCDFCTNAQLLQADGTPGPTIVWEHYNPMLKRWYQLHDQAIPWDDGRLVRLEIALDVTEQKRLEQSARDSEARYRQLFEQSRDALLIVAPPSWRIIAGNPAVVKLFGAQSLEELLSTTPSDLFPPSQPDGGISRDRVAELIKTTLRDGSWFGEWAYRRLDGSDIICTLLLTRTELSGQTVIQGTIRDITLQKAQQRQLERIAHYDPLTGLPNRALLADRMQQAMAQANRRGTTLAIAYLDLDGFKAVNDRHGHDAGDRLLVVAANRMRQALRETDTLARLGGDEFVAVLADLPTSEACIPTLTRLLDAASKETQDGGFLLRVSASLGVTFYPQSEAIDADQLLRQADQAMYQAKLSGKNRYHLFDVARDQAVRGHHESIARLSRALQEREFVLHYQPQVNMRSGAVVGFEALIRWQHPDGSLRSPADFLPLIEGHPLELELGAWVIDTALRQMQTWRDNGLDMPVSVNIAAGQLQSPGFVQSLSALLGRYPRLPAECLQLEILESSALQDLELITQVMSDCRSLGLAFAIDDFGTGYSSLTYLKRLPAGTLKIDRSFVRDMLIDPDDHAILEGVLGLAHAFDLEAVAEGVEHIEQGEALLDMGCELAQGFGIGRPMPAAEIAEWVSNWRCPEAWLRRVTTKSQ
ncbi:MAG TPA: EAL domain-containing protein [Azoarcus taiwanensis]|nr:EAL domain-containing protein [Azoarcus taiwanensis]